MNTDDEWQTLQTAKVVLLATMRIYATCQLACIGHRSDSQPANLTPRLTLAVGWCQLASSTSLGSVMQHRKPGDISLT